MSDASTPPVHIRPLRTLEEYRACLALQDATWGEGFGERVPLSILKVGQRIGGVTAGAFLEDGTLVGFVFGLTGVEPDGRLVHWSDMLAVRDDMRNRGIGRRLKEHQRSVLLDLGVELMYWTYDPLVARNAQLNLNRLGARVDDYVPDMYGASESPLHRGLGTDRFVVAWPLARDGQATNDDGDEAWDSPPLANPGGAEGEVSLAPARAGAPHMAVLIPSDIQDVQASSMDEAAAWRRATREAFMGLLSMGYRVTGFRRNAGPRLAAYILQPDEPGS